MNKAKAVAVCGMAVALSVVIMLIGGYLGFGTYLSPMLAGMIIFPIGERFGKKYQFGFWAAVSFLSIILVPNIEQNLMFVFIFGLYPIIYPYFQKLPKVPRVVLKLIYFNILTLVLEAVIIKFFAPEAFDMPLIILLMVMGNIIFILYDFIVPRSKYLIDRYLGRFIGKD